MDSLRDFILEELDRRHQSVRAFAELVGVSHPAIGAIINPREGRQVKAPSVEFILKLARATGTNALMLLMLAYPTSDMPDTTLDVPTILLRRS